MNPAPFYAYAKERELIRARRESGLPWPWTDDPILRQFKFVNIKREHDRTSRELMARLYEPNRGATFQEVLFNAAIYRYFGTWEFAAAVGWQKPTRGALNRTEQIATHRLAHSMRTYTGAYMITNCGRSGDKHTLICRAFLADLLTRLPEIEQSIRANWAMEDAVRALVAVDGFATFMAKEVLLDTRMAGAWPEGTPSDAETWTAMGPGARRGASRLKYGVARPIREVEALEVCREVYAARHEHWPDRAEWLTLDDCQFTLCEFDKHERVRLGEGRPRSRYHPPEVIT